MLSGSLRRVDVLDRARELHWYHTMELGQAGITEGIFDLRPYVERYGLPDDMQGMRALDVGTFDGFWAFEMERRGAEVLAIDLDWDRDLDWPATRRPDTFSEVPRGPTFELAKEAYGSSVERRNLSVYHASPEEIGTFDLVFCGSVLIHLRDQALALERIAGLCRGIFVTAEVYNPWLNLLPFPMARFTALRDSAVVWWEPNVRAWIEMMRAAGFRSIERFSRFRLRAAEGWSVPHVVLHARR